MSEKKILVKEVCHETSVSSQFYGLIKTPIPIREIYEIRHDIKSPRVLVGKKVIALLGDINVKIFGVKKESLDVILVEKSFSYRKYIPGDYVFYHLKPCTKLKQELQDIIIESIEEDGIQLAGIMQTYLTFTLEKEYNISLPTDHHKNHIQERSVEVGEPQEEKMQLEERLTPEDYRSHEKDAEEEVYAEVIQGYNQNLTITLE